MYLILSLICTTAMESLEGWLKMRAVDCERSVRELLNDHKGTGLTKTLFDHPLIYGLYRGDYDPGALVHNDSDTKRRLKSRSKMPSYIPPRNFALALLDTVVRGPAVGASPENAGSAALPITVQNIKTRIATIANPRVQRAVLTAMDAADGDLTRTQANLEAWYASAADRASGWYKRRTQGILFILGFAIAILANADSVTVAQRLWRSAPLRQAVAGDAQASLASARPDSAGKLHDQVTRLTSLGALGLPVGWSNVEFWLPWDARPGTQNRESILCRFNEYPWASYLIFPLLGWLMTAIALSLGAPFWFDTLNRIMALRSSVKPAKTQKAAKSTASQPTATTNTPIPEARALSTGSRLE